MIVEYFGCVMRKEDFDNLTLTRSMESMKSRGKQWVTYWSSLCKWMGGLKNLTNAKRP